MFYFPKEQVGIWGNHAVCLCVCVLVAPLSTVEQAWQTKKAASNINLSRLLGIPCMDFQFYCLHSTEFYHESQDLFILKAFLKYISRNEITV